MERLILQKLEEYGDSVVEGNKEKKNKEKKKPQPNKIRTEIKTSQPVTVSNTVLSKGQKKKRKKRRKKEASVVSDNENVHSDSGPQLSGHERRLQEMTKQLGLDEFKLEIERKETKKDEEERKKKDGPEVVVFTSHRSKKSKKEQKAETGGLPEGPDFDMRQARFDVQKFGIKGFQGNQKEEAMTALLIKLGAKPPKNKYLNYKDYQEKRKQQMMDEKQKREMDRKLGYKIPKANRGKKRPRDRNDIGYVDGQVGMWKSGVQIVKKDDLKGFKKAKLK